ncbi:cupin domain-containing protein [Fundidesulfovibrio agrisoli]|uniref:cupin domain-containing protein n=1 Tax=Fundidesulfovibrio agrisoli TaxID=2922717 RepID=UPI001FAD87CC|nr:cupin domain-containing protein [Fundidesulfovibrio agrisoli]
MKALDLKAAAASIDALWSPRVAAQVNDTYVKLARIQGDFVWHAHEHEDEMFVVLKGRLCIRFRDGDVWLEEGQALAIPRGVEHCPHAPEEVHIMLVEPAATVNTGDAQGDERKQDAPIWLE